MRDPGDLIRWNKLIETFSWVLRFVNNRQVDKESRQTGGCSLMKSRMQRSK